MKIAFVTDDGLQVSRHFGRAGKYLVVELDGGKPINRVLRDKMGHQHYYAGESGKNHSSTPHGLDSVSQAKHASMLSVIQDCDVVICGGMGQGAYQSIIDSGKEVYLVEDLDINRIIEKFIAGELKSSDDLMH